MNKNTRPEGGCPICKARTKDTINYKNTEFLRRFVSSFGKIVSRKRNGLCASCQRTVAAEIKRARFIGLLPFVNK
ncbi:30S ribosomal protein S18 [Patescibacteria group bacterium]|nr:30S ribosomal protein S18 [Patescibacteria group bacterium]